MIADPTVGRFMGVAFDTLAYAKELEAAGFSQNQAETLARTLAHVVIERLATKADIEASERGLRQAIADSEAKTTQAIADSEAKTTQAIAENRQAIAANRQDLADLRREIGVLEQRILYKLTLRMGTMTAAAVAIVAALVRMT